MVYQHLLLRIARCVVVLPSASASRPRTHDAGGMKVPSMGVSVAVSVAGKPFLFDGQIHGTSTGNHRFSHEIWRFPVMCSLKTNPLT